MRFGPMRCSASGRGAGKYIPEVQRARRFYMSNIKTKTSKGGPYVRRPKL